jgi:hypothetical protein
MESQTPKEDAQARLKELDSNLHCVDEGGELFAVCTICTGKAAFKTKLSSLRSAEESSLTRARQHASSQSHRETTRKFGPGTQCGIERFTRPVSDIAKQEARAHEVIISNH